MALDDDELELIRSMVRSGFYDRDEITQGYEEQLAKDDEPTDPNEVRAAIDAAFAALEMEKATWPATTDCDRLDAAFLALEREGVIALQNAGYTQSDGYSDFQDELAEHPAPATVKGYCFFHQQDLERALDGGGLMLAFGPVSPKDEKTQGPVIGKLVVAQLERAGLVVKWQGTFDQRIQLPSFNWQRR